MVDEILADRVVPAGQERDLQLRADAVGAGDEHRVAERRGSSWKSPPKEPMSDSTPGVNVARASASDAADGFVAGVDVDAGRLIVHERGG